MTHPRRQALIDRMHVLQRTSPDVEAAAVVSLDGLIIASALLPEMSEDRVSAMSAAMLSLGEQIGKEMGRGSLEQIHIKGENGYVVLMAVGEKAVLTSLVNPQAKLGVLFLDMRRAADDLGIILTSS
ncbi:MAG: roadblock/LC7 family protein [Chloroflexi bacterium]|nr:MAG: roadblock/LC7 family protein [Chloroflexota bacterium]